MATDNLSFFMFLLSDEVETESQPKMGCWLVRFAFASGVWARTSDLRRLFRCLTLGAAVLVRRCHARTEWVCTLLCFLRSHFLFSQLRIKIGRSKSKC